MLRSKVKRTLFNIKMRANVKKETDTNVFLSDQNTSSGSTYNTQSGRQDRHQDGNNVTVKVQSILKMLQIVVIRKIGNLGKIQITRLVRISG